MENGVTATTPGPAAAFSAAQERGLVLLLGCAAALHVFVFSAAFPFFVNTDEQVHLDLAVKYSQGAIPRALDAPCPEALQFIAIYGTIEYLWPPESQPARRISPPVWTLPVKVSAPLILAKKELWKNVTNQEASQPPLYYAFAGLWWDLGKACGLDGGTLLYWLRFLNVIVVVALVWLGHRAARMIFPGNIFPRLAVPALLAFLPQTAFYSIQNDVLSPVCFGAAFVLLARVLQADLPGARLGMAAGLALAAAFLTKISNLPLLAVAALAVLFKTGRLFRAGKLRAAMPAVLSLAAGAGLPAVLWLAWCKINFGDFTGSEGKIKFLGWTHKSFGEWWPHPIFTPRGLWIFLSGNLDTLWQGEILWRRQPLALPAVDLVYAILSVGLVALAVAALCRRPAVAGEPQRPALWLALGCCAAAFAFFGFLSITYDFHDCFYPSRAHPYFTSGRLLLGALIPFLLLFVYGLDCALSRLKINWVKPAVLIGLILFMLISEIATDRMMFSNAYNWFHM